MKLRSFILAASLAAGTAGFAAEPPAAPSATPIKHTSPKACGKQADAKKLTGSARAQFVKDCQATTQAGKSP
jgi:hypothetical protein